ncbi:MAG TPA: IS21 family transposase, partial [Candidatus Dormibacteraeota bacterium]|nr:IS21 family transposase [Candidatus Dormibacteraeota bacterium]
NGRQHRESRRVPAEALLAERAVMHRLPLEPYTAALGETRRVGSNQTIRFGSVPYSLPRSWVDQEVWCRVEGEELVVVGRDEVGLREIIRHELSIPGRPRVLDEHYPDHPNGRATLQPQPRPQTETERDFLALGEGAEIWLTTAAATGVTRIRSKMGRAVELARLLGKARLNEALERAARAGRFGENDLASILEHGGVDSRTVADHSFSAQRGTKAWGVIGR